MVPLPSLLQALPILTEWGPNRMGRRPGGSSTSSSEDAFGVSPPHFVLMLTERDITIPDAFKVYSRLKEEQDLHYVAFKDVGADRHQLQELTEAIHADRRAALLEIADVSERGQHAGFQLAVDLGVDSVIGVWRPEIVRVLAHSNAPNYWPFVGELRGSPLQLQSTPQELREEVVAISPSPGVAGLVLMPYRQQTHDPQVLLDAVCRVSSLPVLVAGGVSHTGQVRSIHRAGAWGFTMGGAILRDRYHDPDSVERLVHETLEICRTVGANLPIAAGEDLL